MGGVDFSGEPSEISPRSFAYLENMYRDYECGSGSGVETVPGYRRVARIDGRVHALHPHPTDSSSLIVHAGERLYRYKTPYRSSMTVPEALLSAEGGAAAVADRKSRSVIADGQLYLVDGECYRKVDADLVSPVAGDAYIPTVYSDAAPLEQPNLLTDRAYEEYHLHAVEQYAYASEGFTFTVTADGVCLIASYYGSETTVVLPRSARIGALDYTVSGIATDAFRDNDCIRTLIVSEGISLLEVRALFGMRALTTLVLPSTVTSLPTQCFDGCPLLKTLYLPREIREFGMNLCDASTITTLHYSGSAAELFEIPGYTQFVPSPLPAGFEGRYGSVYRTARYLFPLHLPTAAIRGVTLDSTVLPNGGSDIFYRPIPAEGGGIRAIYLEVNDRRKSEGRCLSLSLLLDRAALLAEVIPGAKASDPIGGCTLICRFEDRLFLSGNPELPGTVFYTHRRLNGLGDPSYVGLYNCFTDGDGRVAVRALLPTADTLLVLTEELPGLPSLFCHMGEDSGEDLAPRIYPLSEEIGGVGAVSDAVTFLGEALFLSRHGLEAVERTALYEERRTGHRSSAVDARLLREDLGKATLFRFGTYLGIAAEGRIYLADGRRRTSRGGESEYEWYFLSGIGSYREDALRYRFLTGELPSALKSALVFVGGTTVPLETAQEEGYADGLPIYSLTVAGTAVTYAVKDGRAIVAVTDGERYGGRFSPASALLECDGLLFFGTEEGDLLVFNTDKRDENGIIPRRYYSFCDHAYLSGCATRIDDCDLPNRRKSTVRSGGAVRLKAMTGGKLEVRVRTEEGSWSMADTLFGGRGDFGETDFASAEFHLGEDTVVPLREAKRHWVEKQLYFVSEEYQRPFGILSIAYQYRVAGRI